MRVAIDFLHPAHVHFFKNLIGILLDRGDEVLLTARHKDITTELLDQLGLRYETSPDQLRWVIARLRRLLVSHPMLSNDPARVRFVNYGAYSLDLEIFAYVLTSDWNEFLAVREDLYLRIMDIVNESGTGFAFPSAVEYKSQDEGLDAEKTKAAENDVAKWRQEGRLPFPAMSEDEAAEITDTLKWPPEEVAGGD